MSEGATQVTMETLGDAETPISEKHVQRGRRQSSVCEHARPARQRSALEKERA